jgi:hypothetical protein
MPACYDLIELVRSPNRAPEFYQYKIGAGKLWVLQDGVP